MAAPEVNVGRSNLTLTGTGLVTDKTLGIGGRVVGVFVGDTSWTVDTGGLGRAEGPVGAGEPACEGGAGVAPGVCAARRCC